MDKQSYSVQDSWTCAAAGQCMETVGSISVWTSVGHCQRGSFAWWKLVRLLSITACLCICYENYVLSWTDDGDNM